MSPLIFWVSVAVIAYTYAGYALLTALLARARGSEPARADTAPPVTVVIAAYNEVGRIRQRVHNILTQDYPAQRVSVIVVSDGSDDGTALAAASDDARVRVLALPANVGKAGALDAAMRAVATEFVVFTDARQRFAPDTLRRLVAAFADAGVGAVGGDVEIVERDGRHSPAGIYWRIEKILREGEARIGWLHGVSGAVYAVRTELFRTIPPGTILDDMWIPLHVVFAGRRVWLERAAVAYDEPSADVAEEYRRKLRTLAGNWQLIARLPRLLVPWRNPVFFAWFSHKFLRLVAPWALIAAWIASACIDGAFYRFAFFAQTAGYLAAAAALLAPGIAGRIPLLPAAASFVMLNTAALLALPACLALDNSRLWKKH